jgi:mannose-6-phosphate isomerase-like protein (cupin superfamily)
VKLIETYRSVDAGYNPFIIRDNWQVARLNYSSGNGFESVGKIEVHYKTDEVFILLKGTAVLIASERMGQELRFESVKMIEGTVYNIPQGVWHTIAMMEDAEVLIVENANTHLGNYELFELSLDQQSELKKAIKLLTDEE